MKKPVSIAIGAAFACAAAITATSAYAHVTLQQSDARIGAGTKIVLGVPHGCDGKPTTSIRVQIPEGVIAVKPMPKPGWTVEIVRAPYARAYKFYHGVELKEGVREIVWSGGSLSDEHYDEFVASAFVSDALEPGATLPFPVVQRCGDQELRWVEIPAAGQSAHDLKSPAPALRLLSAKTADATASKPTAAGSLVVEGPWTRATPGGATVAGGFMRIRNTGDKPDRLVSVTAAGAGSVEIHATSEVDGVMRMRRLDDGIEIAPGATVELKPGGAHVMLMGLKAPLVAGATMPVTLKFERAGEIAVDLAVAPIGATAPVSSGHSHH